MCPANTTNCFAMKQDFAEVPRGNFSLLLIVRNTGGLRQETVEMRQKKTKQAESGGAAASLGAGGWGWGGLLKEEVLVF